ncbi:MAG: bifunctional nuclease family protein [Terriglobales bacterium]
MIQMSVTGVGIDARSSQPVVVLSDETKQRTCPIWIGPSEARAISLAMNGASSKRPLTHELLLNTISSLGYEVVQIEIDSYDAETYRATINLVKDDLDNTEDVDEMVKAIDARPSDAIALAIVAHVPIFVSPLLALYEKMETLGEQDDAKFKEFVQDVKASDFNKLGVSAELSDNDSSKWQEPSVDPMSLSEGQPQAPGTDAMRTNKPDGDSEPKAGE